LCGTELYNFACEIVWNWTFKFLGANCVEFYSIVLVWGKFSGKILYSFGRQITWNWNLQFWEGEVCVKLVCISLGANCVELACIILGCKLCVSGLYKFGRLHGWNRNV
jgi:hypothetical protein